MTKKIMVNGKEVKPGNLVKLYEKIGSREVTKLIQKKRNELTSEKKDK